MVYDQRMDTGNIVEVRKIPVQGGQVLEVSLTPEFVAILRKHFDLSEGQLLEDDHIRMYVWGAFNNAVGKAEKDVRPTEGSQGIR